MQVTITQENIDYFIYGIFIIYEMYVRIKPTKKCWSLVTGIFKLFSSVLPDRKKYENDIDFKKKKKNRK